MKTVICPGSFDPVTRGHTDYIQRAAELFEKVIVAVLANQEKKPFFTLEQRIFLLKETFKDKSNIEVDSFDGLLIDYYRKKQAHAVVKGVRNMVDYEYENRMALINKTLYPHFETVLLISDVRYAHLSSGVVREVWHLGGDITGMVPAPVKEYMTQNLKRG